MSDRRTILPGLLVRALGAVLALTAAVVPTAGADETIAEFIDQLGDDAFATRMLAKAKLERIGVPAAPALARAAKGHADLEVRVWARRTLDRVWQPVVARLLVALGDEEFATRRAAQRRLESIGPSAVPALKRAIRSSPDPEVRAGANRALSAIEAQ